MSTETSQSTQPSVTEKVLVRMGLKESQLGLDESAYDNLGLTTRQKLGIVVAGLTVVAASCINTHRIFDEKDPSMQIPQVSTEKVDPGAQPTQQPGEGLVNRPDAEG